MIDFAPNDLNQNPEWRIVLDAYVGEEIGRKQSQPEFDGWVPRLATIEGVEAGEMSRVHGRLIAHGLLSFQLGGRAAGITYQLTSFGREALRRAAGGAVPDGNTAEDAWQEAA